MTTITASIAKLMSLYSHPHFNEVVTKNNAPNIDDTLTDDDSSACNCCLKSTQRQHRARMVVSALATLVHAALIIWVVQVNVSYTAGFPLYLSSGRWNNNTRSIVPSYLDNNGNVDVWGKMNLRVTTVIFLLLSAVFQFVYFIIVSVFSVAASLNIIAVLRWLEYSMSASVMIVMLAYFTGVVDIMELTCLCALTILTQACGFLTEQLYIIKATSQIHIGIMVRVFPYLCGWFAQAIIWFILALRFGVNVERFADLGEDMPEWVPLVVGVQLLLFASFGLVPLAIFCQCACKRSFIKNMVCMEVTYGILSLAAKSILAIMVFAIVLY